MNSTYAGKEAYIGRESNYHYSYYSNEQTRKSYYNQTDVDNSDAIRENPFITPTAEHNTSNISLTSSSFAYTAVREAINKERISQARSKVKTEEMLNYFSYGYVNDTDDALVTRVELDTCPWNDRNYLASVVVKAKPAKTEDIKNNIVVLVDKSGSMSPVMSMVKESLQTLIAQLGDEDVVSIVSYASGCKIEAEGKTGENKAELSTLVDGLKAYGATNGEAGIETAYELAHKYYIPDGNNRVVILTDGDFNVGKVKGDELKALIKQKAADGVYLTCCGYRSTNNETLATLANNGNGNAYYIDCNLEAQKVFEEEFGKSLYVAAKDAKCQIEFSDAVASYRLLGYETRQMSDQEFDDDHKDAGEIMADHTTVALYELKLKEVWTKDFILKTTLRYKDPVSQQEKEVINQKSDISVSRRSDYDFMSYVAEYSLVLSKSKYVEYGSYTHLLNRINDDYLDDKYRDDFKSLVLSTKELDK